MLLLFSPARRVNSLGPRPSGPLHSHRFRVHPSAQELLSDKGPAEATPQTEEKKKEKTDREAKGAARVKETEPEQPATPALAISAASETSREQNSAGEHRSGHPMPTYGDLRAQQQRRSR
jgi:hypothetical protein